MCAVFEARLADALADIEMTFPLVQSYALSPQAASLSCIGFLHNNTLALLRGTLTLSVSLSLSFLARVCFGSFPVFFVSTIIVLLISFFVLLSSSRQCYLIRCSVSVCSKHFCMSMHMAHRTVSRDHPQCYGSDLHAGG